MLDLSEIKKKNICIMGLMGSGKSIIGKDLSKYLNLKFYDIDKEIELKTKKKITTIFKEEGESYFRDIEETVCIDILTLDNCVVSLGGGSIVNKKIRKIIKKNSYSIYLEVKLNNLQNRLKSSRKRPLLNNNFNNREILEKLFKDRQKYYEKADLIINNNGDKFQTLNQIKSQLNIYAN
ncbi:shikimate kinase [Pelagibacteraceae bacterium]|nr:shikimate kinase [Pelagibacteraceae bacterium]